ncbi:MAG: hypothetical protein ACI4LQ_08050 [Anaerovoracaceae bacterium]
MFEKIGKEKFSRLVTALLIAAIAILALNLLLSETDGRKQVLDGNGGTEEKLCSVLSSIEGAGSVEAMVEYDSRDQVKGVIVLADGAGSPVVEKKLTDGVATLYDIPVSSVIVFEKKSDENQS